jgi:hypothetical protein
MSSENGMRQRSSLSREGQAALVRLALPYKRCNAGPAHGEGALGEDRRELMENIIFVDV